MRPGLSVLKKPPEVSMLLRHSLAAGLVGGALLVSLPALAQDDGESAPETAETPEETKRSGPEQGGSFTMEGPWNPKPYAQPVAGAMVVGDAVGVSLGIEGGFRYAQQKEHPIFFGKTRAQGAYTFGAVEGWDARIGSFFGPFYKVIGAQTGPDVFLSQYTADGVLADQVVGLDWPITLLTDFKVINMYAGLAPGWYFSGDRDKLTGAIHQLSTYAGIGLNIKNFGISIGYNRLFLGDFVSDGWSFGVHF